jgi:AhpD family alkylhydroperoxidase
MSINDVDPKAYQAVLGLERYVHSGSLEQSLLAIVKIRASQINRCAWCLDMHVAEARNAGVEQRKLDLIAAWRRRLRCSPPVSRPHWPSPSKSP